MFAKFAVVGLLIASLDFINCDGNDQCDQNLRVTISFESYNDKSITFFKNQLAPNFEELSKCVTWDFVPCSTSYITEVVKNTVVLHCESGIMECQMDVLHACADHFNEKRENGQYKLGKFFICMLTDDSQFLKGESCAKAAGLCWDEIKNCKPSVQAAQFCDNRYNLLNTLHEKFVPGVIFNSRYNVDTEAAAIADLKKTVCDRLNKIGKSCAACPPPCNG